MSDTRSACNRGDSPCGSRALIGARGAGPHATGGGHPVGVTRWGSPGRARRLQEVDRVVEPLAQGLAALAVFDRGVEQRDDPLGLGRRAVAEIADQVGERGPHALQRRCVERRLAAQPAQCQTLLRRGVGQRAVRGDRVVRAFAADNVAPRDAAVGADEETMVAPGQRLLGRMQRCGAVVEAAVFEGLAGVPWRSRVRLPWRVPAPSRPPPAPGRASPAG